MLTVCPVCVFVIVYRFIYTPPYDGVTLAENSPSASATTRVGNLKDLNHLSSLTISMAVYKWALTGL